MLRIADKGESTPKSGYLERSLTMGLSNIQIVEEDCGTTRFLRTEVINEKHKKTLIGKYIRVNGQWEVLTEEIANSLKVGTKINIRSTIYCETPNQKICRKCWGTKETPTKYLGILAGQILAERFTQLTKNHRCFQQ